MPDQLLEDKDLDLSPDVLCMLMRRRSRIAAMAAASSRDHEVTAGPSGGSLHKIQG
ncbi:hypothetical protein [Pseudactinotalea suaedae]|jgi:hypothetical protein|uniref:hypothetical protein n=1 Tax=Pseudactinotalea suaedae TaxID=1524924 RepID=UPI0012E2942E|nr:hypothetical protein [Pseudactinotalea suaedae]